ncbi:hypothetical protein TSUD_302750 [Trifolium subterraneum]|uniref:Uncharacterized protein n=1 Tax=Trifolium subterraneum TaxID=3900 RepID=A0A2Z6PES4_TRISU|nr:hypothetical protein TSUD_302750 [Trifolium subterraneum]
MSNHDSTKKRKIENHDEQNGLIQSIVPSAPTPTNNLNLIPTNNPNMDFQINKMGNMTDCNFYLPDAGDNSGLAFSVAAQDAYFSKDNKNTCAYVGSMLCLVVPAFKNSVEAAFDGIGIRPRFISLPSDANENNISISSSNLDWSSILVVFGYCILTLFKIDNIKLFNPDSDWTTKRPVLDRIEELRAKVGCPGKYLRIPFDEKSEDAIRTMLGTHALCTSVISFLMNSFNHPDSQISSLCNYLSYTISWSGDMRVFTVMNKWLLKTKSPVLSGSRVKLEVDNLEETIKAITSHTYPQYFSHLCSASELFHLDVSRFPNLFYVALVLEKGWDDVDIEYYCDHISGANYKTVCELLKVHRKAMANNRVSTRRMPTIPGI